MAHKTAPPPSSPEALHRMRTTRRRDTTAEVALRSELHKLGLRFRVDRPVLPGSRRRADIVFVGAQIAVFVDGCFWHSCPRHATRPKANRSWWDQKLAANRQRDTATNRQLRRAGWRVVRIWEHESPVVAAARVTRLVRTLRRHQAGDEGVD